VPLKGKNELERFVDKFGYNTIWTAITERLLDGDFVDNSVSNFKPEDMFLKFTRNLTVDGSRFEFDAVYDVYARYNDEYGEEQYQGEWFTFHCQAEVDDTLKAFEVTGIDVFTRSRKQGNTTQNFVPVISKKQMDAEATRFLRHYFPEALRKPTKVPMCDIARGMGLHVEYGYILSEDFRFFGQISFSETTIKVFDPEYGMAENLDVTRGTILIDPEVYWERNAGCENFTIAHEVIHWEKHRLFADIKRLLYNTYYVAHRCPKPARVLWDSDNSWRDEEWLEWHANGIGARILMPRETLPVKIAEISADFPPGLFDDETEYYIKLIDELAKFYGTSRLTAKYRLRDMGYEEVNDIQIHEFDFQSYTYEIDEYKAYYELAANPELRMLAGACFFTYADNHFVINHEKCVGYDIDGIPHLTDFAWANLDKCALKFANVRINMKESGGRFSDILYRNKSYETFPKYSGKDNSAAFEFARELAEEFAAGSSERQKMNISFAQAVRNILEIKKIGAAEFQDRTLLSKATYHRLQSETSKPSFRSILAFCAGMDLDIYKTGELLGKAGYAFDGSEAHTAYMTAITAFGGKSIDVRNEFLAKLNIKGVTPLGDDIAVGSFNMK